MLNRIENIAQTLGFSLNQMSVDLGYAKSYLSRIVSGERRLQDRIITAICQTYNVSESWLRTGEGEMFNPVKADEDDIEVARRVLKAKIRALPPEAQRLILDLCLEIQQAADQPAPEPAQNQKKQK